jgi:hypothetical protein
MHSYLPPDVPLSAKRLTERVLEREEEFHIAAKRMRVEKQKRRIPWQRDK